MFLTLLAVLTNFTLYRPSPCGKSKHVRKIISNTWKGGIEMYEFTWKVFKETGNVDTYLLMKELEKEEHINILPYMDNSNEIDYPVT